MHRQLRNQLRRTVGLASVEEIDAVMGELNALALAPGLSPGTSRLLSGLDNFLRRVAVTYDQYDRDIELRMRSLQLSSDELAAANAKLQEESIIQKAAIEQLRAGVNDLLRSEGKPEIEGNAAGLNELATTMAVLVKERSAVQQELEMQKFAMDEHAIISITDLDGCIVYANQRFCKLSGYTSEELIGKNHRLINSEFHPKSFFHTLWSTIQSGQVWRGEIRNRNKMGRLYWVSATIVPLLGETGKPERYIAIRTDITNRKLAEASMEESRSFLQGITDTLDEGLFRLDENMQCIFLNPAAGRLLGMTLLQMIEQPFFDAVRLCDESNRRIDGDELLKNMAAGTTLRSENLLMTRGNDEVFPVSLAIAPLGRIAGEDGWVGSFRDITERKQIQNALQISERRLSVAFDAAETFLWEWNLETGDGFVSDNFYTLLGYQRGEIVFRWNTVAGLLHPADEISEQSALRHHFLGDSDHYTVEHRLRLHTGEWRWFCSTGKITARDAQGRPLRFTGIAYDIHDRKRADEELTAAKIEADRANHMKGQFLANMSHELRTPLNALIGLGHLVQQTQLAPQQRDYLQKMESASHHLLGIINDILDYSKIEAGKLSIESQPFSPAEAVREAINLLQPKAQQKQLLLMFEISAGVPDILLGDRKRIGQILLNLTDNALKFTERGEVKVVMSGRWDSSGESFILEVHVRDEGIGLTPEQIDKLFKPFMQADGSTARRFGGTGLGLAICRELLELMGGSIDVNSVFGVGSDFHFSLPCRACEMPQTFHDQLSATGERAELHGFSALIIEDDQLNQQVATALLESWQMQVDVAGSGKEALEKLRARRFDILLLDVVLPDMDGYEILERVKNELKLVDIPIVILSGHTRPEEREHCIALGASDFVSKPYDFKRLSKIVRGLLGVPEIATESTAITAPTATPEQLQALILQLEPLLLGSNPRAQDVSLQLESACRGHAGATLAKRVRQELELYDFVAANKSFVKLKDEIRSDLCERNYD